MSHSRYFINAIVLLLLAFGSQAGIPQKVTIEHATVFLSGAELISSAHVTLPQGESEMIFTNIAGDMNKQTLSIGTANGVVVESSTFQSSSQPNEAQSPRAKAIDDSIELIGVERSIAENQLTVITEQIALIQENRKVSGVNTGLSVAELEKMLNLVNARLGKLLDDKQKVEKKMAKQDERIALLNRQLQEEQKKDFQPGGRLLVKFYAPVATGTDVRFSYVVTNAGWVPAYELRVEKINAPVKLFYKANVYQNCGVKWNNVQLELSTGNPIESAEAPVLNPVYLSFYVPQVRQSYDAHDYKHTGITNTADLVAVASPGIHVSRSGGELNAFGGRGNATVVATDGINGYVQVNNSGIYTSFDIDLPYSIPSDGQEHMVAIKSYELPATYRYYAIPKKDEDAFLQAEVTKWEDLDLLPAKTSIFYEGSYVGEGYTDVRNINDTMDFSLGRDKKIVVKREIDKTQRSVRTIGTNVHESFAYTISVRNTKKEPISLTLLDQVPISNDKDIEIEDKEFKDGTLNETSGAVKWVLNVKPNETQKVKIGYTIKYPRERTVAVK